MKINSICPKRPCKWFKWFKGTAFKRNMPESVGQYFPSSNEILYWTSYFTDVYFPWVMFQKNDIFIFFNLLNYNTTWPFQVWTMSGTPYALPETNACFNVKQLSGVDQIYLKQNLWFTEILIFGLSLIPIKDNFSFEKIDFWSFNFVQSGPFL